MKRVTLGRFAFQYRSKAEWEASQLILYAGELAVEGDTGLMKVGDGKHLYMELPYFNRGEKGEQGIQGEQGETGAALAIKGTKNSTSDLPKTGKAGDAYMIDGDLYVWSDTVWTNVGRVKGEKGDQGQQGPIGPKGPQGPTGAKGEKGDQGEQGPRGFTGEQGANGIQGPRGKTGPRGAKGDKGDPLKYTDLTQSQKQEMANMVSVDLNPYAKKTDLLTKLSEMVDDTNHRLVTDEEKKKWNEKPNEMDLKNATNVFWVSSNSHYSYNAQFHDYFKLNNSPIITFDIPKDKPIQGAFGPDVSGTGFLIRMYKANANSVFCFAMVQTQEDYTNPKFRMYLVLLQENSNDNVWIPMNLDLLYQNIDMSKSGGSKYDGMVNVLNDLSSKVNQLTGLSSKVKSMKESIVLTQSEYDALPTDQQNDESKIYFIKA